MISMLGFSFKGFKRKFHFIVKSNKFISPLNPKHWNKENKLKEKKIRTQFNLKSNTLKI